MELTPEIETAARHLGQCMRQDDYIHKYLNALEETHSDPEASALEKNMYDEYESLIAREQEGEILSYEDTREFYELRRQVRDNPLIAKRNRMHREIRPYLNQIAEEISFVLGVDYTTLAKSH
jgi:cell fate (sporulation/competence/biofilm development) regulator YlbF (YheA/YmcA/DUF963 family)